MGMLLDVGLPENEACKEVLGVCAVCALPCLSAGRDSAGQTELLISVLCLVIVHLTSRCQSLCDHRGTPT